MAEITENWPEKLAVMQKALGMVTTAEAARNVEANLAALRESGYFTSMSELLNREDSRDGAQDQ